MPLGALRKLTLWEPPGDGIDADRWDHAQPERAAGDGMTEWFGAACMLSYDQICAFIHPPAVPSS